MTNKEVYTNKLRETIKIQLEKNNHFLGNVQTELEKWFDLIEKMITLDFRGRISAQKALEHQFFSEEPQACQANEMLPIEIRNPAPDMDYHEFITKNEKNKKLNFRKDFTFKHNNHEETTLRGNSITDLVQPSFNHQ